MEGLKNVKGKFIKWSNIAKKLGENGADGNGEYDIPDEKFVDSCFGDRAFFPSNPRMKNVG